jgi:hypothetical protein
LYEKTIITNSSVTNADVDVDISNLNVDLIIYIGGEYSRKVNNLELYYPWGKNEYNTGDEIVFGSYCRFYKTNDSITYKIIHKDNSTTDYQRFTIRYTKSTDTAGSGTWTSQGVPAHHYSTTEQVVGTWIDGSTLYEKTINFGTLPNNTTKEVQHNISNVEHIWIAEGWAENPTTHFTNMLSLANTDIAGQWYFGVNQTLVQSWTGKNRTAYTNCYVVLRYTKSST